MYEINKKIYNIFHCLMNSREQMKGKWVNIYARRGELYVYRVDHRVDMRESERERCDIIDAWRGRERFLFQLCIIFMQCVRPQGCKYAPPPPCRSNRRANIMLNPNPKKFHKRLNHAGTTRPRIRNCPRARVIPTP